MNKQLLCLLFAVFVMHNAPCHAAYKSSAIAVVGAVCYASLCIKAGIEAIKIKRGYEKVHISATKLKEVAEKLRIQNPRNK